VTRAVTVLDGGRPGDSRAFVHRKLFRGISRIAGVVPIPGGQAISKITRFLGGRGTIPQTFPQFAPTISAVPRGPRVRAFGPQNGGARGPCSPGTIRDRSGQCVSPASPFGAGRLQGQAFVGRFGPAMAPREEIRSIAVCEKGMVLGKDSLCYDHLPNRDRKYPRGRRPLLTGGDMRAISRARRAGNKLSTAKQDLVAIGMLKPAGPRRRKKKSVPNC